MSGKIKNKTIHTPLPPQTACAICVYYTADKSKLILCTSACTNTVNDFHQRQTFMTKTKAVWDPGMGRANVSTSLLLSEQNMVFGPYQGWEQPLSVNHCCSQNTIWCSFHLRHNLSILTERLKCNYSSYNDKKLYYLFESSWCSISANFASFCSNASSQLIPSLERQSHLQEDCLWTSHTLWGLSFTGEGSCEFISGSSSFLITLSELVVSITVLSWCFLDTKVRETAVSVVPVSFCVEFTCTASAKNEWLDLLFRAVWATPCATIDKESLSLAFTSSNTCKWLVGYCCMTFILALPSFPTFADGTLFCRTSLFSALVVVSTILSEGLSLPLADTSWPGDEGKETDFVLLIFFDKCCCRLRFLCSSSTAICFLRRWYSSCRDDGKCRTAWNRVTNMWHGTWWFF